MSEAVYGRFEVRCGVRQVRTGDVEAGMVRTAAEEPVVHRSRSGLGDRRPFWWYARVVRRWCPRGGRLLDSKCGSGELLRYLSPHFESFGYDEDALLRHRCRTAVPDAVVVEELEAIEAESCNVVIAIDGVGAGDRVHAVRRLASKLVSGGVLFVVAPNAAGLARRLKGRHWFASDGAGQAAHLSRGEWVMLMRKAELRVVGIESDGLWDAPYLPVIPAALQRAVCDVPPPVRRWWPIRRSLLPAAIGESLLITARKDS